MKRLIYMKKKRMKDLIMNTSTIKERRINMGAIQRYIVQYISPASNQQNYKVYDVVEKRFITEAYNNYVEAVQYCILLNRTNHHGWEPILTTNEMRDTYDY